MGLRSRLKNKIHHLSPLHLHRHNSSSSSFSSSPSHNLITDDEGDDDGDGDTDATSITTTTKSDNNSNKRMAKRKLVKNKKRLNQHGLYLTSFTMVLIILHLYVSLLSIG